MLKTNSRFQTQLAIFADVALVCLAMVPALALHKLLDHWIPGVFAGTFDFFWDQAWLFVLIVLAWAFVFDFSGLYDQVLDMGRRRALVRVAQAGVLSLATQLGLLYVLKLHNFPRTLLVLHTLFATLAVFMRVVWIQPLLLKLENRRHLLLVGHPDDAVSILEWLRDPVNAAHYELVGLLRPPGTAAPAGVDDLGPDDRFSDVLHSRVVDDVMLLPAHLPADSVSAWLKQCQVEGIETLVFASHLKPTIARLELEDIGDSPDEIRATISTGVSVNHMITILIALFGGWIWQTLGIETLFILSAVLGLCNSAYAATIRVNREKRIPA